MSTTDSTVSVVHNPARRRKNSKEIDPPNMRIVLLGKDVSTNSRVVNFMLGRSAFESKAPPDDHQIERVRGKDMMIINCPHLLQLNLSYHQIIQTVRECVDLSHPGPHVILLIFKHDECSREDQERLEMILNYFSHSVYEHTLVLTTHDSHCDHQTVDDNIQKIIKKCFNRHYRLKRNCTAAHLIETFRDIIRSNDDHYLIYDEYEELQFHTMKQQTDERDPPEIRDDVRIVLLGKTGVGKSATGNTILNRQAFISEESFESVTSQCQKQTAEINNRLITVIDTPGLFDTKLSHEEIKREMMNCISMILPGPHVFLLLLPLGRFTQEEAESVKIIQEIFGENSLMYTMVIFTKGDQLRNKTIEECLGKAGSVIRNLIEECGNRYHIINNNQTEDQTQVSLLLEKIDDMVKANGDSYYSSKIFREMEQEKHTQQMKKLIERIKELSREKDEERERMKMMMEEEQQSHGRERKKREEEFREIKEKYKREMKEKKEQERQMRDEMRKEREEHEIQRQEERQRREEDEKEKQIYVEQCERLKSEVNKIMKEKERIEREKEELLLRHEREIERLTKNTEEEKLNQDTEKKKREEEYKKEMTEKDTHVRELRRDRDTFKNERDELEKEIKDLQIKYEKLMNTIKNHERERKTKEDEFREREERYKREMKEKEEKERQMRDEMRREREEHERQRREEDEKEKQIYDEQCERLKSAVNKIMKEKERIEREKKDQLEEFEKRIQEERNMREEQEKIFEDKLKLMKEENEDELKRRTTEMIEGHEREKEEMKKICSQSHISIQDFGRGGIRPDQYLQQEETEKIQHLFHKLHLTDRHQNKLKASDVLQISAHSLQSHESCDEKELVKIYLQKLLMMNYRARDIKTEVTNEHHHTQQTDKDSLEEEDFLDDMLKEVSLSDKGTSKPDSVHPMDVQMAVFHCADSFLKQLMVTKLSQCQFALPLLVPHPFTQQIEFPLWTFRQINKSWKMRNTNNDIISKVQPVYKAETPVVSFFRFGSVSSSKSQLMNRLINEKHNTFFHRNCPGSSRTRLLMDGVVEIAWYCPSGQSTDTFTDCVAFCNLHGDAGDNEKQLQILTQMSSVNVVLLPKLDRKDKKIIQIQKLYRDKKPLICLFTEDESAVTEIRRGKYKLGLKDRNPSDVSEELRRAINDCLSSSASGSMFRLKDLSKHSDIRVDEEDDEDCRRGREAAQQMMSLLENKNLREIKETFLPCQGELWHQWCKRNKELHRAQGEDIEQEICRKQREMKRIREVQQEFHINEFVKFFITKMNLNDNRMFFLKWLKILLDEFTTADLSALHQKYNEKWSTVLKLKENNDKSKKLKAEQAELERISEKLQAATFGLEHIIREISQVYESCSSVKKIKTDLQFDFSSLPSLAAEMMISGFPLELMDGDAAHVPLIWITAVLDELIQKLGDQRVFVLSVLGLQSSGKSTMLNAMFGSQFAVSAGHCTRGAFMQLIKVSEEMKQQLKIDYILVVDTEGLGALELTGKSTQHHDNELVTFVVSLGQLTLINIMGENSSEMQDILQIVVQAFLRMKKVKLKPSCMFVHQNVSDVTAEDKNMEGRRRLQETLDEMTKFAAEEEVDDAKCFSDVIDFDVQNNVKYFVGNLPMAPPNPNYCESIHELKKTIISQASKSNGMRLTYLRERIQYLWKALLNERFVFSFRNSLEISAYRRLETEYSKWTWTLRSAMMKSENKLHNQIEDKSIHETEETDLQRKLKEKSEEVKTSMSEFFEKDTDRDILIQWKTSFEIKITELQESIVKETKRKLNVILQQQDLKRNNDAQRTHNENTLLEKSKELALKLKDKTNNEEILKREFDLFWEECVKIITTDTTPVEDIDIVRDVKNLLRYVYESVNVEHLRENTDIFSETKYSDYVTVKKFSEITGQFKYAYKAPKEFVIILSKDDETQITTLISDVLQQTDTMIKSFNISKFGYNVSYIQQLTDYIKTRITEYEKESEYYEFKNEFFIDLVFYIFKRAEKTFTDQHRMFREVNDPVLYLRKKRNEYYRIFQKYCYGATSAAIFGEIICQKLKEPIEQNAYKQTARDLAAEMRSNCPSLNGNRSNLEKHILKKLAEEEIFCAFIDYIHYPRDHFKDFIRDLVHRYIRDKFSISVKPKMNQNIEVLQKKILTAAHESTEDVQVKSGDVDLWLKFFTQKLSDVLMFSVKDFGGVKHDDVDDFKLLEDVIRTELPSVISDISREFSTDTLDKKLNLYNRPDEILIDYFCRCCWVQCPFCKATCINTIENHDGDHGVAFHRVTGSNGTCYSGTTNLSISICTAEVASYQYLFPNTSDGKRVLWRKYKSAGGVYAKWSITPDLSELPYWKWFVCKFQKDLESYYNKTFQGKGKIPDEWRQYTQQDAIESLDKYI